MMSFKKYLRSGFGLVEVLVAVALLGGLALALMRLNDNANRGYVTVETKMEAKDLKRAVLGTLLDEVACKKTLEGLNIGHSVPVIKDSSEFEIFKVGEVYGSNTLLIESMSTIQKGQLPNDIAIVDFVIKLKNNNKLAYSQAKDIRFSLNVRYEVVKKEKKILDCYTNNDRVLEQACEAVGGTWVTPKCELPKCGEGEVLQAIHSDGTKTCHKPSCGSGTFFTGFDKNGNAQCKPPLVGGNCPDGQYVSGILADGTPSCNAFQVTRINCSGNFGECSKRCGGGVQTFYVSQEAVGGGNACPLKHGETRACNTEACVGKIDCVGNFGECSKKCGGGTETYKITVPSIGGGSQCSFTNGLTRPCNTEACSNLKWSCKTPIRFGCKQPNLNFVTSGATCDRFGSVGYEKDNRSCVQCTCVTDMSSRFNNDN